MGWTQSKRRDKARTRYTEKLHHPHGCISSSGEKTMMFKTCTRLYKCTRKQRARCVMWTAAHSSKFVAFRISSLNVTIQRKLSMQIFIIHWIERRSTKALFHENYKLRPETFTTVLSIDNLKGNVKFIGSFKPEFYISSFHFSCQI